MMMETAATLKTLMAIVAARNSPAVNGLAKRFHQVSGPDFFQKRNGDPLLGAKQNVPENQRPQKKTSRAPCMPFPSWAR